MGDEITAGVCDAILKLLVRSDVVSEDDVMAMADEYDLIASRATHDDEREVGEGVAHQLRAAMMDLDPPPAVDPAVEFRAQFQRKQMVERTALIERNSESDVAVSSSCC